MIDDKTKLNLLKEIQKNGNVSLSCIRINIDHATYYRWKKEDKEFRKKANEAETIGRKNNCDLAEHALILLVKEKKIEAVKYLLSHNSPRYKPKTTNAVILHKSLPKLEPVPTRTLEDLLVEDGEQRRERCVSIQNKFLALGGVPPKADGSPIEFHELIDYEIYIEEWYKKKDIDDEKKNIPTTEYQKISPLTNG
ncbi:MAG: hypothetical protein WC725_01955 [Patescibacteria group bacterium]|jgi:hypothetical protein